mmetsp:Transcript_3261/g.6520  ORF Transcript_3261/g.6520 Transcript_3261/m.6520 type:complete len:319 (-) Transcript_3261:19-975(-)
MSGCFGPCYQSVEDWEAGSNVTCAHCNQRFPAAELQYGCRLELLPPLVAGRFVALSRDIASSRFLHDCAEACGVLQLAKDVAAQVLRKYMSQTDANGLVGRGGLFVLSTSQALRLFGGQRPGGLLLDVGAGAGEVTTELAPLFDRVADTEASGPMLRRLRCRGFDAFDDEDLGTVLDKMAAAGMPPGQDGMADCVALLNVLDRCDRPLSLLAEVRRRLRPGSGRLLVALVLPCRPFVERGTRRDAPRECLPLPRDASWEESVCLAVEKVFRPAGFSLEVVARVPYLSQGDIYSAVYALDDAVFLLSVAPEGGIVAGAA